MRSFTSYVSEYDAHRGTRSLNDLPREQQNELIQLLFTEGSDHRQWVVDHDLKHDEPDGLARIVVAILQFWQEELEVDAYFDDENVVFDIEEQRGTAIHLLAGTNLWLRLEEAFSPFDHYPSPTIYNWTEMAQFSVPADVMDPTDNLQELRDYLEKVQEPDDGILLRLPYETYTRGWNKGQLSIFVDRGMAVQAYRLSNSAWSHILPIGFIFGLMFFIPIMIFVGLVWGLGVLILAVVARKFLTRKAVDWVRQDSLSAHYRYRWYSARNIVWARRLGSPARPRT